MAGPESSPDVSPEVRPGALSLHQFTPTKLGKSSEHEHFTKDSILGASAAATDRCRRSSKVWRKRLVKSLQTPWRRQQLQPSWETVRTVELHEEERNLIAQQQAHGCCLSWCWAEPLLKPIAWTTHAPCS
eukprot:s842_g5.t1